MRKNTDGEQPACRLTELLCARASVARLEAPGPDPETLNKILQAGLSAPDHALLRPWRFLVVEGEARTALGKIFAEAARSDSPDLSVEQQRRFENMPKRAPVLIIGIVRYTEHPKVPRCEQLLSAGAAMSYMLVAAQAENFGAIWRTGEMANHPHVREGLGLAANEDIVGFLYVGTPASPPKAKKRLSVEDFCRAWP